MQFSDVLDVAEILPVTSILCPLQQSALAGLRVWHSLSLPNWIGEGIPELLSPLRGTGSGSWRAASKKAEECSQILSGGSAY
jgi:hypothetical protein